jgi:tetratricopeptide (TPR) repeat protein
MSNPQQPRNITSLEQALKDIILARDASKESNEARAPYFFMVGAGISTPSIKMAWEIQQDCMIEAERLGRKPEPISTDPPDAYGQLFEAAYPHRIQRKRYLQSIIEDRPITYANFRLAHLLQENAITNVVATANFDELLEQSLDILAQPYVVADTSRTVDRVDPEERSVQIIHIHGSYRFYDLQNTADEISRQSRLAQDTPITMAALLDKVLAFQVPLVVGYGGWEKDVFMSALYRRLLTPLPYNMYWFCYEASSADSLPAWLKNHPDVHFVYPSKKTLPSSDQQTSQSDEPQERLDAKDVFLGFEQAMGLTNQLIADPLKHFSAQLTRLLPSPDDDKAENVNLTLRNVVDRINRAVESETRINQHFNATRVASESNNFKTALDEAKLLEINELTSQELTELMQLMTKSFTTNDADARHLQAELGKIAIQCYQNIVSKKYTVTLAMKQQALSMMNVNGNIFVDIDHKYDKAIEYYDQAISTFDGDPDSNALTALAAVYNNKGLSLRLLGQYDAAIEVHDKVISKYNTDTDKAMFPMVIRALTFKGMCFIASKHYKEALNSFDQVPLVVDKMSSKPDLNTGDMLLLATQRKLAEEAIASNEQKAIAEAAPLVQDAPK